MLLWGPCNKLSDRGLTTSHAQTAHRHTFVTSQWRVRSSNLAWAATANRADESAVCLVAQYSSCHAIVQHSHERGACGNNRSNGAQSRHHLSMLPFNVILLICGPYEDTLRPHAGDSQRVGYCVASVSHLQSEWCRTLHVRPCICSPFLTAESTVVTIASKVLCFSFSKWYSALNWSSA